MAWSAAAYLTCADPEESHYYKIVYFFCFAGESYPQLSQAGSAVTGDALID